MMPGIDLAWRKSSFSEGGTECVETAFLPDAVAVRDSKHPDEAMLTFSRGEWAAFIAGAKAGEFDA